MAYSSFSVSQLLAGDGVNSATFANLSLTSCQRGDVFIVDDTGKALNTANVPSNDTPIYFACGISQNQARLSAPIIASKVKAYNITSYTAPVLASGYVGYNGSTGDMPAPTANIDYQLRLNVKMDIQGFYGQKVGPLANYFVATGGSATKLQMATSLVRNLSLQLLDTVSPSQFQVSLVASTSGTSIGTVTSGTSSIVATVNRNSPLVVFTGSHGLAVGNYVRISAKPGVATATTDGVYLVASVPNSTSVILDIAYTGNNQSGLNTALISSIAGGDSIGIYAQYLAPPAYKQYFRTNQFRIRDFSILLANGFDPLVTPVTQTAATSGYGYWEAIRDLEESAMQLEGYMAGEGWAQQVPNWLSQPNFGYDVLSINTQAPYPTATGNLFNNNITNLIAFANPVDAYGVAGARGTYNTQIVSGGGGTSSGYNVGAVFNAYLTAIGKTTLTFPS